MTRSIQRVFIALCAILALGTFVTNLTSRASGPIEAADGNSATASPRAQTTPAKESLRVGLQAGHWQSQNLPDELENLRLYGGGAIVGSVKEWEVNLDIAKRVAHLLEAEGIIVDIIPATVPAGYRADAFISIHADGNDDTSVSGFKVGATEFDRSNVSSDIAAAIALSYVAATHMRNDESNITPDMTQYYSFNAYKFVHAIDLDTPGILVELGFLTNMHDRHMMVVTPDVPAHAVADGILSYFRAHGKL